MRLADEVILIANGRITEITNPDKLLDDIDFTSPDCICPNCMDRK